MLLWKRVRKTEIMRCLMSECEHIISLKIESWLDSCLASTLAWLRQASDSRNHNGSDPGRQPRHGSRKSRPLQERWFATRHPVTGKYVMIAAADTDTFQMVRGDLTGEYPERKRHC